MKIAFEDDDRVVITGIGVISCLGMGLDALRAENSDANSAGDSIPCEDASSMDPCKAAKCFTGHINDFGPLDPARKKSIRKSLKLMNRETQMGVASAQQAIQDASFLDANYDSSRIGVCFGCGNVEIMPEDFLCGVEACIKDELLDHSLWGSLGLSHVDPLWILRVLPNMPACHIAIIGDFQGPNNTITQNEASTFQAFAEARNHLLDDEADAMIVGGTGTSLRVKNNDGGDGIGECLFPSEGAAAFVLERLSLAQERGAPIYGEILAVGSSCVIDHTNVPKPSEATHNALLQCLSRVAIRPRDIAHVAIHSPAEPTGYIENAPSISGLLERANPEVIDSARIVGNAGAGGGAINLAISLERLQRCATAGRDTAINISLVASGLASCLTVASPQFPPQAA